MTKGRTDMALAGNLGSLIELIANAYVSSGDPDNIDLLLDHVSRVRRMKRKGLHELFSESAATSGDVER